MNYAVASFPSRGIGAYTEPARHHMMELAHALEVLGNAVREPLSLENIGQLALFAEEAKGYLDELRAGVEALTGDAYRSYYEER